MHHVIVLETTHHHADGVGLADIGEELVAQPLALRRARHQAGDIDKLHDGIDDLLRLDDSRQRIEPRIRHRHDSDIRVDGAERIVLRLDTGLGQGVEQGGFTDVRQADDAAFHAHARSAVCKSFIAASISPAMIFGNTPSAASIACSIKVRSSPGGAFST